MARKRAGRPAKGLSPGEAVSTYHPLTIRVPEADVRLLDALSGALRKPRWHVVIDAIRAYAGTGPTLTEEERRAVRGVFRLHEK